MMRINGINFNWTNTGIESVNISFAVNAERDYFSGSVNVTWEEYFATAGDMEKIKNIVWDWITNLRKPLETVEPAPDEAPQSEIA